MLSNVSKYNDTLKSYQQDALDFVYNGEVESSSMLELAFLKVFFVYVIPTCT